MIQQSLNLNEEVLGMMEEFKLALYLKIIEIPDLNLLILPPMNCMARVTPNDYHRKFDLTRKSGLIRFM